ncbi:hypothetical protein HGRIS_000257 [Hohenbuehelia grisea]|uniref:Uncharacterized protein n=1 Tax=Hohenbuehelia grisea TaxID=104357 RepID=A0ABR3JQP7_9AGAR
MNCNDALSRQSCVTAQQNRKALQQAIRPEPAEAESNAGTEEPDVYNAVPIGRGTSCDFPGIFAPSLHIKAYCSRAAWGSFGFDVVLFLAQVLPFLPEKPSQVLFFSVI